MHSFTSMAEDSNPFLQLDEEKMIQMKLNASITQLTLQHQKEVEKIEQEVAELRDAIVRGEFNPDNNPHHNLRFITPTYPGRNPAANFWAAV